MTVRPARGPGVIAVAKKVITNSRRPLRQYRFDQCRVNERIVNHQAARKTTGYQK
jgi:hypothetical protein